MRFKYISILIVFLFFVLICNTIIQTTPVWHESSQLLAGLNIWNFGRFDTQEVNPPLVRSVVTLPVLVLSPNLDENKFNRPSVNRNEFAMGEIFLKENTGKNRLLFIIARFTNLVFILIGIVFCYIYADKLYGKTSGCLVLSILCFSPFFLGHGATIMNDTPTALLGVIAVFFFWKWLKRPELLETIIAGIMLGFAELSKFTLLIFYPLFLVLWLLYQLPDYRSAGFKKIVRYFFNLCILYVVSIFVINCGYLGDDTFTQLENFRFKSMLLTGKSTLEEIPYGGANRFEGTLLGKLPIPIPTSMVRGIDLQKYDFERGLPSYLRGEWSDHGWWYYYLYALLIKMPLGTIGLFLLAIFCTFFQKSYKTSWRDEMVIILSGIVLLAFVCSQTGFSIHSRYIIPALPFFFIWISKVGNVFSLQKTLQKISFRTRFLQVLVLILLFWSIFSSLWIYPHSISYFNELAAILPTPNEPRSPQEPEGILFIVSLLNAGSRNGGQHLLDSNIDWGQDLFYLEKRCLQHPEVTEISTAIYRSYPLEQTKIPTKSMPPSNNPQSGWYALSVNYLYDREKQYRYFLNLKPVARAGYSIYIYHVTPEDVNRIRREMGLPEI
ncbi:MAG: glycosyltransferase family 39 protein [Planctomycetaceae bacterium]|jgi:hypothetical protein|nr:glycosyltransferase family 39 protein [Planctomycetaceae bacterium]